MNLHPTAGWGAIFALAGAVLVVLTRQGTPAAALLGLVVALLVAGGLGSGALVPLAIFVLGSGVLTRIGRSRKTLLGTAEPDHGTRGVPHVAAKLSMPALACALALLRGPGDGTLALVYVAALAGAFADTAATELGPLIGGRALGLRGLRLVPLPHGAPGGMSACGLAAALAAACAVAFGSSGVGLLDAPQACAAAGAGFLASLAESLLAGTRLGERAGHFGRNAALSLVSAGIALSARALGWAGS